MVLLAAGAGALSAQPARSQWSGIFTEAQAKRGEPLYAENCAYCHGQAMEGTHSAPPLTGEALAGKWRGRSLADLFEYQQQFMPLNSPGGFSRQQNADIIAYMFKRGNVPAGKTELPTQPDAQRQIMITLTK